MRSSIDSHGRLVVPKAFREALKLSRGGEVEISLREGKLEIEPATLEVTVQKRKRFAVFKTSTRLPKLSAAKVRETLSSVRGERD